MSHSSSDAFDTWDISILDHIREMGYSLMGACAAALKEQKVVACCPHVAAVCG